jgi:hypothetical protein
MTLCGRTVCWCQRCEQSVPWWRWGYGMGRYKLRTTNTIAFYRGQFECTVYRDEILRPIVVPFICSDHLMCQHGSAQPHFTRTCTQFLEAENSPVLPWPACSDMSPIEHVWDALDQGAWQLVPVPANIQQVHAKEICCTAWPSSGHTRYWLALWSMPLLFLNASVTNR